MQGGSRLEKKIHGAVPYTYTPPSSYTVSTNRVCSKHLSYSFSAHKEMHLMRLPEVASRGSSWPPLGVGDNVNFSPS